MIPADPNAATGIPLSPVPTQYGVGQGIGADGQTWVLLTVSTPLGNFAFHLTPDNAKIIGEALAKFGTAGPLILGAGNGHQVN